MEKIEGQCTGIQNTGHLPAHTRSAPQVTRRPTPGLLYTSLLLDWQENLMIFELVDSFKLG